jgi:hypothetical protein
MNARTLVASILLVGCRDRAAVRSEPPVPDAQAAPPSASAPPAAPIVDAAPPAAPVVREQKAVVVDGVAETWRLVWRSPPEPACVDETWSTCLCAGLAFGEKGHLDLVRARPGMPDETLSLDHLSEELVVQRWVPAKGSVPDPIPLEDIKKRPTAEVMRLADYDHDGRATEFVLQIDAGSPCGRTPSVLVGISKAVPALHVFGTVEAPKTTLVLEHRSDWEKLRQSATTTLIETACGDHGAEEEASLQVRIDAAGFHATPKTRPCPPL